MNRTMLTIMQILKHYESNWGPSYNTFTFDQGPLKEVLPEFKIIEFPPRVGRENWTYATLGMSTHDNLNHIELHIFSKDQDRSLAEILAAIAYFNLSLKEGLNLGHTVNFGRSWKANSKCKYGLISLPYLDGPKLETLKFNGNIIKFYWLLPITEKELKYKKKKGLSALENKFDNTNFNYVDPNRRSVVWF